MMCLLILERGREREEGGRERNIDMRIIDWWPPACTPTRN